MNYSLLFSILDYPITYDMFVYPGDMFGVSVVGFPAFTFSVEGPCFVFTGDVEVGKTYRTRSETYKSPALSFHYQPSKYNHGQHNIYGEFNSLRSSDAIYHRYLYLP